MCNVSRRKCQINYELTIKEKVKEIILAIWLVSYRHSYQI